MSLEMGPENLRSDPLRLVEKMLMEAWELRKHKEDIYLILAELFSNALDYGVLGLDGAMKKSPEGFDEFFSLRQKALEFTPHPDELVLSIRVEDSGPGFDHSFIGECAFSENITCRGRGIQLLGSMCKSLRYNEKGNCVEAVYAC
jgi:anti-sigma regulatory factor (Ser/Thr protein kinase)